MIVPRKKTERDLATVKCQKCLEIGHFNYECQNKRKLVIRDSRTKILNKNLTNPQKKTEKISKEDAPPKKRTRKHSPSSSSSSSDSDSSSVSSSSSSSSSSSDSDSDSSSSSSDAK